MKTHLVIPDPHAHFQHDNSRADLLAKLIMDLRPDVVINLGDQFDMPSLASYDKGKKSFHGRSYSADINSGLDFSDRLWAPVRRTKKRLPYAVFLIGNHEERIRRAIEMTPELDGTIGYHNLELDRYYDDVVDYDGGTPGIIDVDGILYSHYLVSGTAGRPLTGENPGSALLAKKYRSVTVGHSHQFDHATRNVAGRGWINGLHAGCFVDYRSDWAGSSQDSWRSGVVIKRNVYDGDYDLEFVSIDRLRKEYG